ncbi:MAG: hypothetical protein J6N21_02190 [Butyrivibrio sp.]|nr:hypothetical protein [Butyrivibrio sp.]
MVKDSKRVDLYCKCCRKSLHMAYELTGHPDSPLLPSIIMKCPCCTKVVTFKKYIERNITEGMKNNRYYL